MEPFEDPDLPAMLAGALEMRDQGIQPPLEEICRAKPELLGALKRALELSPQIPELQRVEAGQDRLSGRVLGSRYRLESRLGSGAMGVVYRAEDMELGRTVAIKVLRFPVGNEEEAEIRFGREAEALAAIRHPAIVAIHDLGRTGDDNPYLVMDFIEGVSLGDLLVEVKRTPGSTSSKDTLAIAGALGVGTIGEPSYLRVAVRWIAELANGLIQAHGKGIFHRDIKPSNILVRRTAEPVLLDFGIAAQAGEASLTRDGSLVGTPAFMAPEALDEGVVPGPALDIYSITATLYQMLTLRPPYSGTPTQVLTALSQKDPEPASRLEEGLPRDLLAILDHGMARRPSERYRTMADFEADLRAFLDYRPVKARSLSVFVRGWRFARRSAAWRAGAAVAAVGVVLLLSFQVRSMWRAERQSQFIEVWQHLPPNLGIAGPATRVLTIAEGRMGVQRLLDEAVRLSDTPLPASLIRAMFRVDHGQLAGAAADMRRVGNSIGTPYAKALAERYVELANRGGEAQVDLSELPMPVEAMDHYLAGVHDLRLRKFSEGKTWLEDPRLAEYVPAQICLTLFIKNRALQLERGMWLEQRIGRRTAGTANLIGLTLVLKQDYRAAYEVLQDGLQLAPHSYPLLKNAARSAWMLGLRVKAKEHYERILAARPDNVSGHELYIRFLNDTQQATDAQAALDAAPFGESGKGRALRHELQGSIDTERALEHRFRGHLDSSLVAALSAEMQFCLARRLGKDADTFYSKISTGILLGKPAPVFEAMIESLEEKPLNSRRFQILEQLMPASLDEHETELVRKLFAHIRRTLVSRGLSEAGD